MKNSLKPSEDFLFSNNAAFVEELYAAYLQDPSHLDPEWQQYFASLPAPEVNSKINISDALQIIGQKDLDKIPSKTIKPTDSTDALRSKLQLMLTRYRENAHKLVVLDPLGMERLPSAEEIGLSPEQFDIQESCLDQEAAMSDFAIESQTVGNLVQAIQHVYSSNIGIEFAHIHNQAEKQWIANRFEQLMLSSPLNTEDKKTILSTLAEVETFEQYIHTKFPGAKRFSIEGGETTIAAIDFAVEKIAKMEHIQDVVIGMAHRGRLATLTKIAGKPYHTVLAEFMGTASFPTELDIAGDVKYHMGYSCDRTLKCGSNVHISLAPNPSHLEAVNPVVAGQLRAKQDISKSQHSALGILLHGDAAFCGQGIVAECFAMDGLPAYSTSGIIHFVINNQIGFTADSKETRNNRYSTEFAKIGNCPILHVNGEDPEAVILATLFAIEYRHQFNKACVVDVVCYRKYGHNEGDEPMYTQAPMYNIIKRKQTPGALYAASLEKHAVINAEYWDSLKTQLKTMLNTEFDLARSYAPKPEPLQGRWAGLTTPSEKEIHIQPKTGVSQKTLLDLGSKIYSEPHEIAIHPKLKKLFHNRMQDLSEGAELEWAIGETLAFATMLTEGTNIRISGQDAERGTFSHRHSVLYDQTIDKSYTPLNHLSGDQGHYDVANSFLSEYGVLGFEYGYASVSPKNFVIWEAQFGDFANGAQIMFDQFISSAETKWLRLNGLVMLLPHGYEGQGPEHSSARVERFLQLSAENNMQIVIPTTPASIFHVLRRQMHRNFRKPLVVMTPKSLLRHKLAVSSINDIAEGTKFSPVIDDISNHPKDKIKKLILCSGKVYYDLLEEQRESGDKTAAIIRLEQLYPFPHDDLSKIVKSYKNVKHVVWCQEEPQNMGAWHFVLPYLQNVTSCKIDYAGRRAAASPAAGYAKKHLQEQQALIKLAFTI